jgi:hypothetical protein
VWRVSAGVRLSLAFPPSSSFVPAVLGSKRTAKSKQSGACFGNQHRSCPRRCGAVVGQRQRADCDSVLLHARVQVVKTERIEWKGPFVCVAVLKTEKAIVPYVHTYLLPRESHTACAHTWQLVRTPGSLCAHLAACANTWQLPPSHVPCLASAIVRAKDVSYFCFFALEVVAGEEVQSTRGSVLQTSC